MRMNYNQIIMGSLLCENVVDIEELAYTPKSKIEIPFLSKTKKITFPLQKTKSVSIKCKKIFIEAIDKMILDSDFKENIRKNEGKKI